LNVVFLSSADLDVLLLLVLTSGLMDPKVHPSSDELEAYSRGPASDPDMDKVEEHLLICGQCRIELTLSGQYVRAVKKAVPALMSVAPTEGAIMPAPEGATAPRAGGGPPNRPMKFPRLRRLEKHGAVERELASDQVP
jgi:hypothetical protein